MGCRIGAIVAGLAVALGLAQGAEAAVRYEYANNGAGFVYTADTFVTAYTILYTVDSCYFTGGHCYLILANLGGADSWSMRGFSPGSSYPDLSRDDDFDAGAFSTPGAYIGDRGGTLTVTDLDAGGVPEPATWALMIAGFGLAGAGLRRRGMARA